MSVLQTYLHWANSVLAGIDSEACPGVAAIQEGKVICMLIDALCPEAGLQRKALFSSNPPTPQVYLRTALDHMRNHGIKFHFTPQDILDGDIKSILDVLWLIILNYSVHNIASSPYQRSVGIGKKILLDWCQKELETEFDPQNSLTYNLCTGDWFLKLLARCTEVPVNDTIDREKNLKTQLEALERRHGIKQELVKPSDITEGTVDEHTLMIYVSLLRLMISDSVDNSLNSSGISFKSEDPPLQYQTEPQKVVDVPSIILSDADDTIDPTPASQPTQELSSHQHQSSATQSAARKFSPEGSDTSDWSSGSPISSMNEKFLAGKTNQESSQETESLIKDTISEHIREQFVPNDENTMSGAHGSRIPVRVKPGEERAMSSPGRLEQEQANGGGPDGQTVTATVSVKLQRPRSPNSIMAEARQKQELEKERRKRDKEEIERRKREEMERRQRELEREETVYTGSASEGGEATQPVARLRHQVDVEPIKSDEDDQVRDLPRPSVSPVTVNGHMNGDVSEARGGAVPVFVMPNKKHDMEVLLEALKHARTEASAQDVLIQASSDQPDFKDIVDKNIEQLEVQLAAVKAQSRQMFEDSKTEPETSPPRGRAATREPRRGERRSPPRGILDMMVNQHIEPEETSPKERFVANGDGASQPGILRYRDRAGRSPTDHAGKFSREDLSEPRLRPGSRSPDKFRSDSPHEKVIKEENDADKRLIKFLSNEIENLKLKMTVLEKGRPRSQSPYGMGPRITSGLPERDRSPAQISSRARARISEFTHPDAGLSSYSPLRRGRASDLLERSRSPRFDSTSPTRSMSRSPARSPSFRSRTPDYTSMDRPRSISPSVRVLSLQDLSTAINDDPAGKVTFNPASGSRPVDLGYSSPIRKVHQEIWGHGQTQDEYYADTAKYEQWKRLIARDATCDEDMLELKQALASALVELDIVTAKLKNANDDIKQKMCKTTEVLNDCRAHLTKSQAENAELRGNIEKEKAKSEAQEVRLREMEEGLTKSKVNVDDRTLELEESVMTLKGIINLDKNQIVQLEEENDKLRKRMSDFQRENIKVKEDFNELKIYNDKAQGTIKDLKQCLEDARGERRQLVSEITRMKEEGRASHISGIINNYMEKGLYEEPEKARPVSRSQSPVMFNKPRSTSPAGRARSMTPVRSTSPVRSASPSLGVSSSFLPLSRSRSQSPSPNMPSYGEYSPDNHEIYPHRRTQSYVKKFGAQNEDTSRVDLNDPDLQAFLKPQAKLTYDLDDGNSPYLSKSEDGPGAKRQLLYSPYMDKDFVPKSQQNNADQKKNFAMKNSTPVSHRNSPPAPIDDNKFMQALDNAVKETPTQLAQKKFLHDLDMVATSPDASPDRWRSPSKGILKSNKSLQNMSIKENSPGSSRRSIESRSYSPVARSNMSRTYSPINGSRSFTPDARMTSTPYSSSSSAKRSVSPSSSRSKAFPAGSIGQRSYSQGNLGSYSPASAGYSRSHSPGDRFRKDSGYSTPTQSAAHRYRNHERKSLSPKLLSEEERRYADLLIEKYTSGEPIDILECYKATHGVS